MPPSGTVGWLHIFTPPWKFSLPPPFCSVITFIELSRHWCSYGLLHFMTLLMLLKLCEILFLNLCLQYSITLCRVSVVVFASAPLTGIMPSARKGSAGRETVDGGQLTLQQPGAEELWSQAIRTWFCTLSALLIITIPKEVNKFSCAACVTVQSWPAWTL